MERAAAGGAHAGGKAQLTHGVVEIAEGLAGAGCVLVGHVGQNLELDELGRNLARLGKPSRLEMGQIELAEQHGLRGSIEATPARETQFRIFGPRHRGARGDGLLQMLLWAFCRWGSFAYPSHVDRA